MHRRFIALCAAAGLLTASAARADLKISELYFDSPSNDLPNEYIEFKGTPSLSLNNYYLVILENEVIAAGSIDHIFDLSGKTMGTNGYMVLRMNGAQHTGFAPGTNVQERSAASAMATRPAEAPSGSTRPAFQVRDKSRTADSPRFWFTSPAESAPARDRPPQAGSILTSTPATTDSTPTLTIPLREPSTCLMMALRNGKSSTASGKTKSARMTKPFELMPRSIFPPPS
jgi:hypothetical protein